MVWVLHHLSLKTGTGSGFSIRFYKVGGKNFGVGGERKNSRQRMRGNLHMRCAAWHPDPTVLGKCKAALFGFDD